jgi:hypothetical protein
MQIPVILTWGNIQVQVQRRPVAAQNDLGEVSYGDEDTWPIVNDPYGNVTHTVRIEFASEVLQFTPTGERLSQNETLIFLDPNDKLLPEDRITIVQSDINPDLPSYFILHEIWPEYNSVGDTDHYLGKLEIH